MGITQNDKALRFQELHQRPGALLIPNPWDAGSARLLAGLGFEAFATSSAAAAGVMGRRDGRITREESLANARLIVEATDLPVAADLEHGFGDDPPTAAQTILIAAKIGLVGGSIEDARADRERPIYDIALATERIAASVEAARSLPFPFTLAARAENYVRGNPNLNDTSNVWSRTRRRVRMFSSRPACRIWQRSEPFAPLFRNPSTLRWAAGADPSAWQSLLALA